MKRLSGYGLALSLVAMLSPAAALAATLELTDGRIIDGTFLGGTRSTVRFAVDGAVEVFVTRDILALTFTEFSASSAIPTPPSVNTPLTATPSGAKPIVIPAGSQLVVRLQDAIDSREDAAGKRFTGVLDTHVAVRGSVVLPKGATVYGRLASATAGGRVTGRAELGLELTDVVIDGRAHPIVTGEYAVQGRTQGTAKKTLGGAVLGAIIDGEDGAKAGAAAGFGLSLLSQGKQVSLPDGTLIMFRLLQPLYVDDA